MCNHNGGIVWFVQDGGVITLSTTGTTTTVCTNCIPAQSIVMGVVARVETTITSSCTGWELGDGTTADHMTPVKVTGVTGLTSVDASGSHTCAVTVTGATVCWGDNSDGQLGDGPTTHRSTPVTVGTR